MPTIHETYYLALNQPSTLMVPLLEHLTVGQLSEDGFVRWLTVEACRKRSDDKKSANCLATSAVGRLSGDFGCRATVWRLRLSGDCRATSAVGRLSGDCRATVERLSSDLNSIKVPLSIASFARLTLQESLECHGKPWLTPNPPPPPIHTISPIHPEPRTSFHTVYFDFQD